MERIKLTCENCGTVHDLRKTSEIPSHIFIMHCNCCPNCEYPDVYEYEEWWDEDENNPENIPIPVGDNQLCMPFIMDEIGVPKTTTKAIEAL